MFEDRDFMDLGDYKPMTNELEARADHYNLWNVQHTGYISEFKNDIQHVRGQENQVTDALFRLEMNVI